MLSDNRKQKVRTVIVEGQPSAANVYLNNQFVAQTPCSVRVNRIYKKNVILVEQNNYIPQKFKVRRKLRGVWLAADIFPGVIVLGIPLVVDFASGAIFKVKSSIVYNLSYTDEFYRQEYNKISKSINPNDFKNYMEKYPESVCFNMAKVKVDSLDYISALNMKSDAALGTYIETHPTSKFNDEALQIKNQLYEARTAFEKAVAENSAQAYIDFLNKYPKSFHVADAVEKLMIVGENDAKKSNTPDAYVIYITEILWKYAKNSKSYETKMKSSVNAIQDLLVVNSHVNEKRDWDSYSLLWKSALDYEGRIGYSGKFDKIRTKYEPIIKNEIFNKFKQTKNYEEQDVLLNKVSSDFPQLIPNQKNTLYYIIEEATNKNGTIKLYQNSYLIEKYKNYERASKNLVEAEIVKVIQPNMNSDMLHNVAEKDFYEELTFVNNNLHGTQNAFMGVKPVFSINYNYGELNGEATFYENGKKYKSCFCSNDYVDYTYEFKDGVNLTLKELSDKIKLGDKAYNNKDYDEALRIYQYDCNNKFPPDVAENIKLKAAINKVYKAKEDLAKKGSGKFDLSNVDTYLENHTFKIFGFNGGDVAGPNYITIDFYIPDGLYLQNSISAIFSDYCPSCATKKVTTYCDAEITRSSNSNLLTISLNGPIFKNIGISGNIEMIFYLTPDGKLLSCFYNKDGDCTNKPDYSQKCVVIPKINEFN
jgi:hypothetical protein